MAQWHNRNKQNGNRKQRIRASNNARKYYLKSAKHHARIANQRRDFLQKTTTEISRKYAHIRIEDLNVQGMIANHKLAAAIADLGFYEFRRQLEYKAPMFGTRVELVDQWYPSSKQCNKCHRIQAMPLVERVFVCGECGHTIERDLGAAINLKHAPSKVVRSALTLILKRLWTRRSRLPRAKQKVDFNIVPRCPVLYQFYVAGQWYYRRESEGVVKSQGADA